MIFDPEVLSSATIMAKGTDQLTIPRLITGHEGGRES
jgi:hypothetical protein